MTWVLILLAIWGASGWFLVCTASMRNAELMAARAVLDRPAGPVSRPRHLYVVSERVES